MIVIATLSPSTGRTRVDAHTTDITGPSVTLVFDNVGEYVTDGVSVGMKLDQARLLLAQIEAALAQHDEQVAE